MLLQKPFIFDGKSSADYNMIVYYLSDDAMRELEIGTNVEAVEERLLRKTSPIHYGNKLNQGMVFPITFGCLDYIDSEIVDEIIGWLTGHNSYKIFSMDIDDEYSIRVKAMFNNFKVVALNGTPLAFSCDLVCDSQFSYSTPITKTINVSTTQSTYTFNNPSVHNGYIYPVLTISLNNCSSLAIVNESDNNRRFEFSDIPSAYRSSTITVDCNNQIITSSNSSFNPYEYFNGKFLRLVKGKNVLKLTGGGSCTVNMTNEYLLKLCSAMAIQEELELCEG